MTWLWASLAVLGTALSSWAGVTLALIGVKNWQPVPPVYRTRAGPYRWLKHPMYIGQELALAGVGGLAAGHWGAIGFYLLANLVQREWRHRENLS